MKLKSFIKRLFGGEVIEKFVSPINGEIFVIRELSGRLMMRVGGISQSGGMVENIWREALKAESLKLKAESCLVLGLGAGTVANILIEKWPGIKITGVEIDPKVIEIGKKYFNLSMIPKLKININGAIEAVEKMPGQKFDLILVDLYIGQEYPEPAENSVFLKNLIKILNKGGMIIFNRLNFGSHKSRTAKFTDKLKKTFSLVSLIKTEFNLFLLVE